MIDAPEGWFQSWFQRACFAVEDGLRPYMFLTLVCLIAFGIGVGTLPPTDRDEARFMQATKQMIETGDYTSIRVQDTPRTKKPIGIHWLQAASVRAFGQPLNAPWPYRIPSALGAWLAVLATCACGRRLFGARAGLVAGLTMATLPLTIGEAHLAKTDAMLLGLIALAMAILGRVYADHTLQQSDPARARWLAIMWLAVGGAMLIKGPVVVLVGGATLATLAIMDRSAAILWAIRPLWGLPLAALVVAPWLALLVRADNTGFIGAALREDVLPKLLGGQESHGAAPGSYLVATVLTAWPWSLLIPVALVATWPARSLPAVRFCLAWLVPAWLMFEAIPTKLPHYILPLMPAAALLLGAAVQDGRRWRGVMTRAAGRGWRALYALISVALAVALTWAAQTYGVPDRIAIAFAALACVMVAGLALAAERLPPTPTAATAGVAALLFCTVTIGAILPQAQELWISTRLSREIARRAPAAPAIALVGFHEPSAVFLLGTKTRLTDAPDAAAFLLANPGAVAVVDAPRAAAVMQAIRDGGGTATELARVDGFNYARGAAISLRVIRSDR